MKFKTVFINLILLISYQTINAAETISLAKEKDNINMNKYLSERQKAIIPIAAFAADGDMNRLHQALNQGLDKGLSINEIKELLIQSYAYAGFPRSLNALNEFMQVLQERSSENIKDVEGNQSNFLPKDYDALKQGTLNQTKLVGQSVKGPIFDFAPDIDKYLKAHLFGDIFSNSILNWKDREIATVSMLASLSNVDGQLKSHIHIAKQQNISDMQLKQIEYTLRDDVSEIASQRFLKSLSIVNIK